ncbi:MAG: strB [Gammaproteobacteria bacterium]|jgi:streptomycin 6-kinase|nr:strB [Gammaproteobacteria bacterium]
MSKTLFISCPVFVSNISEIYKEAGKRWLESLSERIRALSDQWGFKLIKPIPDLSYHFVGLVEYKGQRAIIKMGPDAESLEPQVNWLTAIGKAMPKVYAFDAKLNAYLMEQIEPGYSLKSLVKTGDDDKATRIICELISALQSKQSAVKGQFKHLSELAKDLSILKGHYDKKLLSRAESLFHELSQDRSQDVLLHGDLHHDNILQSASGWKVIDPHGYIGDPAAEVGAMIRNPYDCFPQDRSLAQTVDRRLKIMAKELPFDPQRMKAWAFCMTVLSDAWTFEGHGKVTEQELASAIYQVKL